MPTHYRFIWEGIPITTLHKSQKGQFHAIEVMIVFVGWMLLVAYAWNYSNQLTESIQMKWNSDRAYEMALAQSTTLIEQHHSNPWKGCAHYNAAKKRVESHLLEENCLQQLSLYTPTALIQRISLKKNNTITYFSQTLEGKQCHGIERGVIIAETGEAAVLEVTACA